MKIGVFDSGMGGEIVAKRLKKFFPHDEFLCVNDRAHLPYGNKTEREITELTIAAIQPLLAATKIIVVACNTATAAAIATLRAKYPNTQFIGFEPAIKPAANDTNVGKIIMLATPATLNSAKYLSLKRRFAHNVRVFEPDCSDWATKIENGEFSGADFAPVIKLSQRENVDEIVLGCTHYLAIEDGLRAKLPSNITIIEPIAAVAKRLAWVRRELC
jgi:glutamate racemase